MSFVFPIVLVLLLPLGGLLALARSGGLGHTQRLPGTWHQIVTGELRGYLAARSGIGKAGVPVLCFATGAVIIAALARPGIETRDSASYATLAGRVVILDVGADLARHRQFIDGLYLADPGVATSVIAASGDAYRIVPFTSDKFQIDRYVRVLRAEMIPDPGQNPHTALAMAERNLADAGFLTRQIVLLSARQAPRQIAGIPPSQARRFVVPLGPQGRWPDWSEAQGATLLTDNAIAVLTRSLRDDAQAMAQSELPSARTEFTSMLIALAAVLWLLLFRRRAR